MTTTSVPTPDDQPDRIATDAGSDVLHDSAPGAPVGGTDGTHEGPPGPTPSRHRRRWLLGLVGTLILALLLAAKFVPTPYYLLEPGSVRAAEPRVEVKGAKAFHDDGDVMFTTVVVGQATLVDLVQAGLDDAIDVKSREDVYGDESRTKNQQLNQARMDLSKLVATKVALNYLGDPAQFTGKGARVLGMSSDAPAKGHLEVGDVITEVDNHPVTLPGDISTALAGRAPGDVVTVVARRPGSTTPAGTNESASGESTVRSEITLGTSGDTPARPVLGVSVEPDQPALDSKVQVSVDSGEVIGPSAGLAWTLAIVDRLTPGSLTDGRRVAVTGEIESDGTVGPIGGIVQKVATVKRAGVKLFLYPASTDKAEVKRMKEVAGDELELRPVANIADAVKVLAPEGVSLPNS